MNWTSITESAIAFVLANILLALLFGLAGYASRMDLTADIRAILDSDEPQTA